MILTNENLRDGLFSGAFAVSFREGITFCATFDQEYFCEEMYWTHDPGPQAPLFGRANRRIFESVLP